MVRLLFSMQMLVLSHKQKQYGVRLINTNVPRMCFVNKMDKIGADFYNCVDMIVDRLGRPLVVIQLPIGAEDDYEGHIDLVKMKAVIWDGEAAWRIIRRQTFLLIWLIKRLNTVKS